MRHEDFDNCYKLANDLYTKAKAQGKMPVMLQLKGFKGHTELADPRWQELPPYVWHHYVVVLPNKEGVPTDELDVKGLDLMKSNFPPLFRKFGEHIINEIMFGKPKADIDKQILDFRTSVRTIDWKKILKPTGLKKVREYIASPPRSGEVFSKLGNKCPINTKSAIYYNDILKFKGLDKKFPTFQIGDKMYIAYLKDNPYRIDVVGFNGYNDPPEIMEFIEKYIDRDGLFDSVMKNKLESLYSDLGWGAVVLNQNINKFFKF